MGSCVYTSSTILGDAQLFSKAVVPVYSHTSNVYVHLTDFVADIVGSPSIYSEIIFMQDQIRALGCE